MSASAEPGINRQGCPDPVRAGLVNKPRKGEYLGVRKNGTDNQ